MDISHLASEYPQAYQKWQRVMQHAHGVPPECPGLNAKSTAESRLAVAA